MPCYIVSTMQENLALWRFLEGETLTACKGDIVFIPKGTIATFSSEQGCFAFYVTYPLFQETKDELARTMIEAQSLQ